jgi:hypothetical protein
MCTEKTQADIFYLRMLKNIEKLAEFALHEMMIDMYNMLCEEAPRRFVVTKVGKSKYGGQYGVNI